jgi:hypothetical protein
MKLQCVFFFALKQEVNEWTRRYTLLRCTRSCKVDWRGGNALGLVCRCSSLLDSWGSGTTLGGDQGTTPSPQRASSWLALANDDDPQWLTAANAWPGQRASSCISLYPPCMRRRLVSSIEPPTPCNRCTCTPASKPATPPWFLGGYASLSFNIQQIKE